MDRSWSIEFYETVRVWLPDLFKCWDIEYNAELANFLKCEFYPCVSSEKAEDSRMEWVARKKFCKFFYSSVKIKIIETKK